MNRTKYIIKVFVFLFPLLLSVLLTGCYTATTVKNSEQTSNSVQNDYNTADLNNYGEWIYVNNFGEAWRPYVVRDWQPFTNGRWIYSGGEWIWYSYEPFGWIVYHYGYWYDDPYYGWVWIPSNNVWSPARVIWINYDNYTGWAPMPPPGVAYGRPWDANRRQYWHVVRDRDFAEDNIGTYTVPNRTINNYSGGEYRNRPPDRNEIERRSGRKVREINLRSEEVRLHNRDFKRMQLPPDETANADKNKSRVRRDILIHRNEYQKQQNQRNQENQNRQGDKTGQENSNGRKNDKGNNNRDNSNRNNNNTDNNNRNNNNADNSNRHNNNRNNNNTDNSNRHNNNADNNNRNNNNADNSNRNNNNADNNNRNNNNADNSNRNNNNADNGNRNNNNADNSNRNNNNADNGNRNNNNKDNSSRDNNNADNNNRDGNKRNTNEMNSQDRNNGRSNDKGRNNKDQNNNDRNNNGRGNNDRNNNGRN